MSLLFLALLLQLRPDEEPAAGPPLPEVQVLRRGTLAALQVLPPEDTRFTREAPVHIKLRIEAGGPSATRSGGPSPEPILISLDSDGAGLETGIGLALGTKGLATLEGEASFSLCAVDGSNCRRVELAFEGELRRSRGRTSLDLRPAEPPAPEENGTEGIQLILLPEQALERAAQDGKLVLLDFYAVWCPPCNQLSALILDDPADAPLLEPYWLARVDSDTVESWSLKDRYKVRGYPTLLVTTAEGTEVDRMEGFVSEADTALWLSSVARGVEPIEVLAERALGGGPALGRAEAGMAARRLALSGHDDAARAALKLADEGVEKHIAMLRLDGRKEDVAWLARQATEKPSEWLAWVPQAAWDDPTLARTLKNVVEAAILSSDPATASDMLSTLGDRTRGPESRLYTTMAAALLVAAQTGDPFHDRGFWLDLAELHRRAGSLDEALEYLDRGVQAFPNEFTFHYARGRLLQDLGRHEEALQSAEAALANSYGDSLLRAAMLCARLLDQVGREDEALRLLDAIEEKATRPGPELKVRTHRYLEELRRTREELRKPR